MTHTKSNARECYSVAVPRAGRRLRLRGHPGLRVHPRQEQRVWH